MLNLYIGGSITGIMFCYQIDEYVTRVDLEARIGGGGGGGYKWHFMVCIQ